MNRALVIDDCRALRNVFSRVLVHLELLSADRIDTAQCGPSGMALLSEHDDYDLVISDNIMPNTNLDVLFEAILNHAAQPAIVAIGGALEYAPPPKNPRIVRLPLPARPAEVSAAITEAYARRPTNSKASGENI